MAHGWKKYLGYTLEWRVIATSADFAIIYLWTGQVKEATALTVALILIKSTLFFFWRRFRQ